MDILKTPWGEAVALEMKVAQIIQEQVEYGWVLDIPRCKMLVGTLVNKLKETDEEVLPQIPLNVIKGNEVSAPFKKNGELTKRVLDYYEDSNIVKGPFTKVTFEEINLNSVAQVKDFLFSIGWEPDEWNEDADGNRTSPRITSSSLLKLGRIGQLLDHRTVITHRKNQLLGFLKNVRPDGRIEARANSVGTNTCRMKHKIVVNVPKAKASIFFGKEMRSVFTVPEGRVLVGGDAKGLENRVIAHYLQNPSIVSTFIEGDFHDKFWKATELYYHTRDSAKNGEYAYFFGAGDWKLGYMADFVPAGMKREEVGREIRKAINDWVPGLDDLIQKVKRDSSRGYVISIDGRKIWIRGEHSAFNSLVQSSGAIIMKKALCFLDNWIKGEGLDAHFVGNFHDEFQIECAKNDAKRVAELFECSVVQAGRFYKMNCPLEGESKIGTRWSETH